MAAASAPLWAVANFVVGQEDINFGTLPPGYPSQTKTFSVKNTGNATGSFKVQVSQSPTWITTSPGNNATVSLGAGQTTTISVTDIAGFPNNTALNATINIVPVSPATGGGAANGTYLFVSGVSINVSPQQISFSMMPGEVKTSSFSVSPAIEISATPGAGWLKVSPAHSLTGGTITVTADASGMTANTTQTSSIDVYCGYSGPCIDKIVSVSINVVAPPQLQVNVTNPFPISVVEGATATSQFTMDNTGGVNGNFTVTTSSSGNWLSTGTSQGTIAPGSELSISLVANAQSLTAGSYPGQVSISLNGVAVRTFSVNLTVTARPKLISDTSTASFAYQTGGSSTACGTKSASINSNPSGNAIKYAIALTLDNPANAKWLTVSSAGGTTPGSVTLTCDATGLQAGSYTGRALLSTNDYGGSSQQISVSLTVTTPGPSTDITVASTASYTSDHFAAGMIASLFGKNLAANTVSNSSTTPPTTLGGASVMVKDSAGTDRASPLFFVSSGQINFQVPLGTVNGTASVRVVNGTQTIATTTLSISPIAPGLFYVGTNTAAATAARYIDGQAPAAVTVFQSQAPFPTVPIDLTPGAVYVSLYATGLHYVTASNVVKCTVGGVNVPVLYAGDQGTYPGLDQVNIQLIQALAGLGEVDVVLTVDGIASNAVRINIH
jgi:uncharacterized protein (TIGR03437 family)